MLSAKRIAAFFFGSMAVFVLLMAPWPGLEEAYGRLFRAGGNLLFVHFGPGGTVHFRPSSTTDPHRDTELVLTNRRSGFGRYFFISSRVQGYKPTAFILALTLGTPLPWSRRWRAVLWGFLCVNVYVIIKLVVLLLACFSRETTLALFPVGPMSKGLLEYLNWLLVVSEAGRLILPLGIWVLVTFRRKDWEAVLQRTATKPKACSMTGK